MKFRFLCVLLSVVSFLQASNCRSCPIQGPPGTSAVNSFAYFTAIMTQTAIANSGGIVNLTVLNAQSGGYALSGNGASISSSGTYQITFRVLPDAQTVIALFQNGNIIPSAVYANNTANVPIMATVIVSLNAGDVITIRNVETAGTFNTVIPGGAVTSIPVEMVLLKLSD